MRVCLKPSLFDTFQPFPKSSYLTQLCSIWILNLSLLTRFSWGKTWFKQFHLCKKFDISHLCDKNIITDIIKMYNNGSQWLYIYLKNCSKHFLQQPHWSLNTWTQSFCIYTIQYGTTTQHLPYIHIYKSKHQKNFWGNVSGSLKKPFTDLTLEINKNFHGRTRRQKF